MKNLYKLYQDGRFIGVNISAKSAGEAIKKADSMHKAKTQPITAIKQDKEIVY